MAGGDVPLSWIGGDARNLEPLKREGRTRQSALAFTHCIFFNSLDLADAVAHFQASFHHPSLQALNPISAAISIS
jgi:hypothetical protein